MIKWQKVDPFVPSSENTLEMMKFSTKKGIKINFNMNRQNQLLKMMPLYNKDCLYYTPSFQNDEDKILTRNDQKIHLFLHKERIKHQCSEIDYQEIMVPKPSEKNSYCKVCRTRFEDYMEHINHKQHIQRQKQSPYNKEIEQLCQQQRRQNQQKGQEEYENFESLQSEIRKKVKIEETISGSQDGFLLQSKSIPTDNRYTASI